ncbi:Glutamate decarboxylase beta [Aquisphaera giovannonii]|uniref:Glutamate decarboxylase n=1 Tax=Aquisphaera giovannonii TaxID=406548 RepID=A0A5B9W4G3_9BACT|nr:glutamate decarboxylase [Aquisphaera giovannonii]QEH35516.1 Glutamate decarboxylase beta [Aquisphaera giovannonii]
MPLHARNPIRDHLMDDVYASNDLSLAIPKYRMPAGEHDPRSAHAVVQDELMLDGNSRLNLATFCQTWVEPEVRSLMGESLDKNMIDKDEYPQTAEIESRCVHMIADLWHAPHHANTIGCSATGSSEAAMLGGLALKWRWREKRRAAGAPADRPNLVCGPVQVCWHKFARYFDVELREVPLEPGRLMLTPEEAVAHCDENTIGVVPTLGVTFTLKYEPVAEICAALDDLQARTGLDVPVHVDAASGGFVAPFLQPDLVWDFRLPRVKSINASGHKYGLTPLGCGWVVWREKADLPDDLIFHVDYLGGDLPTFALNFSRPGGQVICQYYNLIRLGREGYRKVQHACRETAAFLADHVAAMGPFDLIHDGRDGLPGVCWTIKPGTDPGFTLYDLADRLRYHGWQVPTYPLRPHCESTLIQRALVRHGFSRDLAKVLLRDLRASIQFLHDRPNRVPLGPAEAEGYHH